MGTIQLPFPPLAAAIPQQEYREGEPVIVTLRDEKVIKAALLAFDPKAGTVSVRVESKAELNIKDINLNDVLTLEVPTLRKIVRAQQGLEVRGKVVLPAAKQEFEIVLTNGGKLTGNTVSFRIDQNGLYLFPTEKADEHMLLFIAAEVIESHRIGPLLGRALVKSKVVSSSELAAGLAEQKRLRDQPIGEYLKSLQVVSAKQLQEALARQKSMPRLRLGEVLVQEKFITEEQLQGALREQEKNRKIPLGEILVTSKLVTQDAIRQTLAKKLGIPFVDLRNFEVDLDAMKFVPEDIARKHQVMPLYASQGTLVFAIEDPMKWEPQEAIRFCSKLNVEAVMATQADITWAIEKYYGKQRSDALLEGIDLDSVSVEDEAEDDRNAQVQGLDKPIIRFVNGILLEAVQAKASDIHIRPGPEQVDLLFRVHGELKHQRGFAKKTLPQVVSRIKIMGHMNIAERRRPQDGRVRLKIGDRNIDFRVSVIPTVNGESVVIRVLDKGSKPKTLDMLGLRQNDYADLVDLLHRNAGLILVTGATGSGKSSTLYAALQKLVERNIHTISIEEPVEAEIAGVEQIQVNNASGYTFALALRNILRHDPDAIMVGEIRDQETAKIALESAMTGHLVLSTLHTNDAPSTIGRLLEMEIEPYLLSAALLGIMSQRLVRLNCPHCLVPEDVPLEIRERLSVHQHAEFYRSSGCPECNNTGNAGRSLAYEFLRVTPELRRLINEGAPASEVREQATLQGMVSLTEHAVQLAKDKKITLEQAYLVKQI